MRLNFYNCDLLIFVYYSIFDEINRGEISKIFGELFFSIDPDYRSDKDKVKTQYQNLVEKGDDFDYEFYVPENVYIIDTMNDIDRIVESIDFAFGRRNSIFEFKNLLIFNFIISFLNFIILLYLNFIIVFLKSFITFIDFFEFEKYKFPPF